MHSVQSRVRMDRQVHMTVPMLILPQGSQQVHITRSPCQQKEIRSDISLHSVLVVMLHSSLVVVGSMDHSHEDSTPMTHHIRHPLHGRESSRFLLIIQSTSISILDSTLNSRHRQEDEVSVSVQRRQVVDSKYGLEQQPRPCCTSVDHRILDSVLRDSTLL